MDNQYNLYNYEFNFKLYLESKAYGSVTVKNYVADLRNFLQWTAVGLESSTEVENLQQHTSNLVSVENLAAFIEHLRLSGEPVVTTNRKLSALRKFCSFCVLQGWIEENTAKKVANVSCKPSVRSFQEALLADFAQSLSKKNMSASTNKNYIADIREFLNITSSIQTV